MHKPSVERKTMLTTKNMSWYMYNNASKSSKSCLLLYLEKYLSFEVARNSEVWDLCFECLRGTFEVRHHQDINTTCCTTVPATHVRLYMKPSGYDVSPK